VSESERDELRLRLEKAILTVLRKHPALQYFQGYHDVSVFPREELRRTALIDSWSRLDRFDFDVDARRR